MNLSLSYRDRCIIEFFKRPATYIFLHENPDFKNSFEYGQKTLSFNSLNQGQRLKALNCYSRLMGKNIGLVKMFFLIKCRHSLKFM